MSSQKRYREHTINSYFNELNSSVSQFTPRTIQIVPHTNTFQQLHVVHVNTPVLVQQPVIIMQKQPMWVVISNINY